MSKHNIFFRADGHAKIGLGHVIRSLALAEMLKDNFHCHFIIREPLVTLKQQILEVCESIIELPNTDKPIQEAQYIADKYLTSEDIVVLDGYNFFKPEYQQNIKNKGSKLVCIDDLHEYHFIADVIINNGGGAKKENYSAELYTQFYLGLSYALLRKPFREASKNRKYINRDNSVFICLGGADPNNDTLKVLKRCEEIVSIEQCYLIIGWAYQHEKALHDFLKQSSLNVQLLSNLSASEMVHYMQKCGKAITPPSSISLEYFSINGELYLIKIAENQRYTYQYFIENQLAFPLEDFPINNTTKIEKTILKQQAIFDGNQAKRFQRLFQNLTLVVRRASLADMMQYFHWTNDPATRQQSFNSEPIPLENHQKWFNSKVISTACVMYVVELDGKAIGQIRFDFKEQEAIISFSLDKAYRGRGLGLGILQSGVVQYQKEFGSDRIIVGFVKKNNTPSLKAFRTLGFEEEETTEYTNSYKYSLS